MSNGSKMSVETFSTAVHRVRRCDIVHWCRRWWYCRLWLEWRVIVRLLPRCRTRKVDGDQWRYHTSRRTCRWEAQPIYPRSKLVEGKTPPRIAPSKSIEVCVFRADNPGDGEPTCTHRHRLGSSLIPDTWCQHRLDWPIHSDEGREDRHRHWFLFVELHEPVCLMCKSSARTSRCSIVCIRRIVRWFSLVSSSEYFPRIVEWAFQGYRDSRVQCGFESAFSTDEERSTEKSWIDRRRHSVHWCDRGANG